MLAVVAIEPATAMLATVAIEPATAMLATVAMEPATAMLPAVAIEPVLKPTLDPDDSTLATCLSKRRSAARAWVSKSDGPSTDPLTGRFTVTAVARLASALCDRCPTVSMQSCPCARSATPNCQPAQNTSRSSMSRSKPTAPDLPT
jgi:hypothetical protein